jgi:hypothetical protein
MKTEPNPVLKTIKGFGPLEGSIIDQQQYDMLEVGDLILVQLDQREPEVRKFTGWGLRSPLLATKYMGYDYSYFFVDGSHPRNPQTKYHRYAVDKSRFRGWAKTHT